ncbi:MAG: type II toxin-antitoxin system MqsA family antitoxin [Candidatus Margulisiibacteriota bacterium]
MSKETEKEAEEFFEEAEGACEACGGDLKPEKVNLEELEGGKLYLMENVPAMVCEACGEIWVPEPILKEFEKMMDTAKRHKSRLAKRPKK